MTTAGSHMSSQMPLQFSQTSELNVRKEFVGKDKTDFIGVGSLTLHEVFRSEHAFRQNGHTKAHKPA